MESETIKYRAILEALNFQNLDGLKDLSLDECVDLGVQARDAIQSIIDANNELRERIPAIERETWEKAASLGLSLTPDACKRNAMLAKMRQMGNANVRRT